MFPSTSHLMKICSQTIMAKGLTLSGAGVWRLNLGGGGVKNTPPLYINVSSGIGPKIIPNLISRRD